MERQTLPLRLLKSAADGGYYFTDYQKQRMIIIKSRLIPKDFCVNVLGTVWTRDTSWIDKTIVNHERIHTAQQKEMLWLPFYLCYLIEWLVRLAIERNMMRAYRNISFEREAYAYGGDLDYLKRRKHYAWLRPGLRRARPAAGRQAQSRR